MDAYIYQADLHCEDCASAIEARLGLAGNKPDNTSDESSYDSDDYPKGPFSNGGGESDSPAHCGTCGVFLENPLTTDGEQYVRECIASGRPVPVEWAHCYSYLYSPDAV